MGALLILVAVISGTVAGRWLFDAIKDRKRIGFAVTGGVTALAITFSVAAGVWIAKLL